jgi:hypothetical protein
LLLLLRRLTVLLLLLLLLLRRLTVLLLRLLIVLRRLELRSRGWVSLPLIRRRPV